MKKLSDWHFFLKILCSLAIAISTAGTLGAQIPTITSFSPTSGPIGTTVTINGTNFSTTVANDIVWFGAVQATVTTASATQLSVTVPIGATYQPISVTISGNTAYSNAPFNVTFPSTRVIDATAFAGTIDFATGTGPYYAALGDIDGDGKPDLVVTNNTSSTISVYKNISTSGSITASSFATRVDFSTGAGPYFVAIGDIDGDGKPDLAIANNANNSVSVLRNMGISGSITTGSFAPKVDFTTGTNPHYVTIGDIDGDGKPDLAVSNYTSSTVSVFQNISTSGSITTSSFAAKIDLITGTNPSSVVIGDIDGDSKPDLIVANYTSNTVSVFRNISTSGSITTGSFAAKVDFTAGTNPFGVVIGDIDGDGKPDLAIENYNGSNVSVFRNTSTSGSISFEIKVDFTTGVNPMGIAIGDIDGDNKPDLAVTNLSNTVSILKNTSTSGSITASSFATRVDFTTGASPIGVALGDLDGDGKLDLAVPNIGSNTVSVLRNTIATPVPPVITSFTPTSGPIGTTITITGTNFNTTAANNIVWFGAVKAAVKAATSTTLSVTVPTGATYQPVSVTVVTTGLTAYSITPFNVTFPSTQVIDATAIASKVDFTTGTGPYYAALGDIDGDGKPDLVVTNYSSNNISIYRNISSSGSITAGSFATKIDFNTGLGPFSVVIGDIDGDGKPDLVVTNAGSNSVSVFKNTGTSGSITASSFAAKVDFATGTSPYIVAIGDIDGDGKPDLAVTNYSIGTVSVLRNISTSGSITTSSFAAKVDLATGTSPFSVAIGDIDGDGKPDLAIANQVSNTVSVFKNISTAGSITSGSFAAKVDFVPTTSPLIVAIGDIDGDGKPDLVVTNGSSTTNTISVFRNTSTSGSITTSSFAAKVDFVTGTSPYSVAIGDIDGDGKPDLTVTNTSSYTVSVFRNTSAIGSITLASKVDFTTGSASCVAIGDIDGDGKPDLAIANNYNNSVSVLRNTMTGPPIISSFAPTSGPIGTSVTITGNNFSSTVANNIVWFGAVKATVTSATSTQLTVTVPTGATYQPITVTVNGLTDYSSVPFTVTFSSSQIIDVTTFASKIDFTTGASPYSVAIGDLDGDGKPDLAVANYTGNSVSVFRNTSSSGSISAGSFAAKVDFTTGTAPTGIAIGDIDGDGKLDLAVTNYSGNTVSVFRNTSTSGSITAASFATKVDFATVTNPQGIAIGDIDGDGKPDVAVTNYSSNSVSILRNTSSSGSITSGSLAAKVDFSTGTGPYGVVVGDIDGDGKPDLAVTNNGGNTVSVFLNTSSYGSIAAGSFASKVDFITGISPYGITIGDIDGDSKPDLAVTITGSSNSVSVFRNTSTSGSITSSSFANKVDFATGTSPRNVAIGDIDGDGKPDLAVANYTSSSVSVFRNTSTSGTITASSFASKVDFPTGTNPFSVAICDIDGDGKPDLAVANYAGSTVSVLRNTISAAPPYISSFTPTSGPIGTTVTITGSNFSPINLNNIVWFGAVQATVTSATSTSLSVTVPTGATYQPITVTVNGLTEYSNAPFNVTFPTTQTIDATAFAAKVDITTGTNPFSVAIGDIDGDSKPDLAFTNPPNATVSVLRNTSTSGSITSGSFGTKADFTTGTNPDGTAIGDIDGDGKPDLVVANANSNTVSVFRNTSTSGSISTGSFAAKVDFNTGILPQYVAIGDIDGDGRPDLVVTNSNSNSVSVFRNTGTTGTISSGSFAAKVDFSTGTGPYGVVVGDIDGDGKPDLVVTNYSSTSVSVFRNTSTPGTISSGSFATKVDFTTGSGPYSVVIGDIDGDGKPDLAVANFASSTVSAFRNTSTSGSVTFAPKVDFITGTGPRGIAIGDIDGDGKPDLTVANYTSNTVSIFRNTGTSGSIAFNAKVDFTTGTNPNSVTIGDIDGDGKPDLTIANLNSGTASVFRNTIAMRLAITSFTPTSGPIGTSVTLTGANFSTTPANNIVWFGAVKATVTAATATQLTVTVPTGATYQPITVTVNGLTAYSGAPFNVTFPSSQLIDATAIPTRVDFTVGTGPWVSAIGDIDGDGKPDLAVMNYTSSTVSVFRNTSTSGSISGSSFATRVDFATGTNPKGIAIGDIDGDGKPDLVVANYTSGTVSVFRNTATSGSITASSFAARVDFTTGTNPDGVVIGDIDGDGRPDLAVANYTSSSVSVFRNTSTSGSITASSFAARVDFLTGTSPYSIVIGDIDGDSKPDLAVTNYLSNTVSIFRNTSTSGTISAGSFAARVDFPTSNNPTGLAIGDIDGDGKPDLVVTNYGTGINTVSVLRNTSTSGSITTGSFATTVDFAAGTNPNYVAIGDIDGDGKPDLVVANYGTGINTVSVFRNTGSSGSLTAGSFAAKVDFGTGTGPNGVAIGDIDGDGKPDVAVANGGSSTVSVLRNTIVVRLAITSFTPTSGPIGSSVILTGANFSTTLASNVVWFGAVKATVTAATATQLTVTVPTGATYQPITVTVNGLTAYSSIPFTVTFSSSRVIDATSFASKVDFTTGTNPYYAALGDIDGDGKSDLAVVNYTSSTVSIFRNTSTSGSIGASSFAAKADFTTGTNPVAVAIGDIDGDGKQDLVIVNYSGNTVSVFRNTSTSGSITFAARVDFITGLNPSYVVVGDIDGDGKPDLSVANATSNTVSVLRNTSTSGTITSGSFATKVDFTTGTDPEYVAIGDIDGDGKPDLVVANYIDNTVSILRNTSSYGSIGAGSFASNVDFTTGTGPCGLSISDIDGDGKPDLAATNNNSNTVSIFRNTATSGSIGAGSLATKVDFITGSYPWCVTAGDIDGDGKPDLAVGNDGNGTVSIFRNTSTSGSITTGSFTAKFDFTTGSNPSVVVIGDIDGDGKPDLCVPNYSSNSVSVFRNTLTIPPTAPTVGTITRPTCTVPTGSVVLNGLPATGNWTLTRAPGGTTTSGTGTSSTISGLVTGTYSYTVTNTSGTSASSANVLIGIAKTGVVPTIKIKWSDVLICYNLSDSLISYRWYKASAVVSGTDTLQQYFVTNKQAGAYKVVTIDKNGCKNTSNIISVTGTKSAFSVYPNPVSKSFAIKINDESEGNAVVTIFNSAGTKVMEFHVDLNDELLKEIPVNNLNEGIYVVQVLLNHKDLYYTKIMVIK